MLRQFYHIYIEPVESVKQLPRSKQKAITITRLVMLSLLVIASIWQIYLWFR